MHIHKPLRDCALGAFVLLAACLPGGAQDAADYPNRPIRVIVPVGAGAGVDTAARITTEAVEKHLGQRFVIENKPGAGSRLGAAMVAKAPADGYTLLFTAPSPIVVAEHFPQKMDFEPAKDFQPVAVGVLQPALLVVRPNLGVRSVDEFVAYAKNNPGKLSFGIQGLGGEMHLSLELFKTDCRFHRQHGALQRRLAGHRRSACRPSRRHVPGRSADQGPSRRRQADRARHAQWKADCRASRIFRPWLSSAGRK